jgi:hypothetical protein
LFVSTAIVLLEVIRASGRSTLRVATYLAGTLLRNPLVISPLLGNECRLWGLKIDAPWANRFSHYPPQVVLQAFLAVCLPQ